MQARCDCVVGFFCTTAGLCISIKIHNIVILFVIFLFIILYIMYVPTDQKRENILLNSQV